jgi:hypothetical protein
VEFLDETAFMEAGKKSKKDITMLDATVPHQAEKI